eukprot:gb/GECG01006070.1/.p1 GENE.gb/GECG01006070.1/~~gb/GECG01006070.1/.p1  ORF type:complete len:1086 (+),score=132.48 gb/GECG01006070.1/:1-3258(+)
MQEYIQKLIQCESLTSATHLIACEVLAHTSADDVLVLVPVRPSRPDVLAGCCARRDKETGGPEVQPINSAYLPDSLPQITTETEISRSEQEEEPISYDSSGDRLSDSIASFVCRGIPEQVHAFLLPFEGAKGIVELAFAEDLEDDDDLGCSNGRQPTFPQEEQALVKRIKMNGFYVLNHLRETEMKDAYRQKSEILMQLVQQVANAPNKQNAIELSRQAAMELVDAKYVTFFLVDDEHKRISIAGSDGRAHGKWQLNENSLAGYCVLTGQSVNAYDISRYSRCDRSIDCHEYSTATSLLAVPIRGTSGTVVGVITALDRAKPYSHYGAFPHSADSEFSHYWAHTSPTSREECWSFDEEDEQWMQKMGAHVGSVLGRVDAFHQLERQREINEAVLAVVRAVSRGDDIQSLLHCIVTAAYKIANPERVSLYLVDNFRQELWLAISRDISGKTFPMDVGIASSVAREGKTVLIEDAYSDPRFNSDIDKETGFETKQVLCLPISLVSKTGSPIAVLQLLNKTDAPSFTHEDQEAMEAFCYEAAVALKRMSMDAVFLKLFEEENKSSGVHSLTRMPSNTGFEGVGDFQPYRVRELAPRMAGSRRLSVTSASNRRFQMSLLESFSDDSTFDKLHSEFASGSMRFSTWESKRDIEDEEEEESVVEISAYPHLQNRYGGQQNGSRDDWVQNCDLDMNKEKQLFQWETNILSYKGEDLKGVALQVFHCWNLTNRFDISIDKLRRFIEDVRANYRPNPFHNFYHAVETLRATLLILARTQATTCLSYLDMFSMLVAAFCHDVDHPGNSQTYEILTRSPLAIRHNDSSVLERHHAHTTFSILSKPKSNILESLTNEEYRHCRKVIISAILGTDMSRHFTIVTNLSARAAQYSEELLNFQQQEEPQQGTFGSFRRTLSIGRFDDGNPQAYANRRNSNENLKQMFAAHRGETREAGPGKEQPVYPLPFKREKEDDRLQLIEAVVHTADLSAQAAPYSVAKQWGEMVISEFQREAEKFKLAGMEDSTPVFMKSLETTYDRSNLQASFVEKVVLPLWENMHEILGGLHTPLQNLHENLKHYKSFVEDLTEASRRTESCES